jgi:hypothetical protein
MYAILDVSKLPSRQAAEDQSTHSRPVTVQQAPGGQLRSLAFEIALPLADIRGLRYHAASRGKRSIRMDGVISHYQRLTGS